MPSRRRLTAIAAASALALGAAACGDDEGGSTTGAGVTTAPGGEITATATNPIATAPEATEPPADATTPTDATVPAPPPETDEAPPPPANTQPAEPEATDEAEPVRVPATFTIDGARLDPPTITVPPFLAVEITVSAADGANHLVVVQTPEPHRLPVQGDGSRAVVRLAGLRAGRYAIEVDGREAGTLVAGGEVGP